jgi:hypothetical protein
LPPKTPVPDQMQRNFRQEVFALRRELRCQGGKGREKGLQIHEIVVYNKIFVSAPQRDA